MLMRVLLVLVLGLFAVTGRAETLPHEFVQQAADQTIARLKAERAQIEQDPDRIYGIIQDLVIPHFDFIRMSKWVLGKHWRDASPDQRKRFTDEFRTMLVRTYASSLMKYVDDKITYQPAQWDKGSQEAVVHSSIDHPGGQPVAVSYRLYLDQGNWKIFDVTVEDISLVINYRSSFSSEISAKGMDGLIEQLVRKNRQSGNG
ncbi:MAG: putative toluene tolerance protein [Gammaproteobacteria bacterium]|nr:MAG: putative toluene tolerance protein [Gammaproteobacteria bacterium]TND06280.1 MAG: putative toluene tolerance protein [Gammaproteobacteria bacterium]